MNNLKIGNRYYFNRKNILLKLFAFLLIISTTSYAQMKNINFFPKHYVGSIVKNIKILDVKELKFKKTNDIKFTEISDLAYNKEKGLYALSDQGYLYHLSLKIKNKKIKNIKLIDAFVLKSKKGKRLKKKKRDSEGLAYTKDGLIISFERKVKVSLFDFKANKIKNFAIPTVLKNIDNYQDKNLALESVTFLPKYGIITIPEAPLKFQNKKFHTIYSLHKTWRFKVSGKVTAVEVMQDNNLLVLERIHSYFSGYHITLKKIFIDNCDDNNICKSKTMASFKSSDGWYLDNFEGLTKLNNDTYLMISDDNENFMQKCIIILFKII